MKKLIFPLTFCMLTIMVSAQPAETVDSRAVSILQALDKKTKIDKTIYAEFAITLYGTDRKPGDSQKGILWVKGSKYKYDIKNQMVFCDSINTWTYLKDANEVQINKVDPTSDKGSLSPATLFSFYEKGFKSHFIDEEKVNSVLCECIELYPKHPEKEKYHTIRLFIDKTKNQVTKIVFMMKDGTFHVIVVNKFIANSPFADDTFIFNAKNYPGVEVEDLRE